MVTITDERPAGGWLRLLTWSKRDEEAPAHAFQDGPGFVHRSLCDQERWTVKRIPATTGPACIVCGRMVRAAIDGLASQLVALDELPTQTLTDDTTPQLLQYQGEGR